MSIKRTYILCGIIFSLFICLIARIAYLQFYTSKPLAESAFKQKLANNRIEKLRGNILDRNGIPFTNRERSYTAFIKTAYMPKSSAEKEYVCAALGIEPDALNDLTLKSGPVLIKTNEDGKKSILDMNTGWVTILNSLDRYGGGTLARHVIGYLNRSDLVGQAGIEKAYEKELGNNTVFEIGTVTDAAKNPIKGLGYRIKKWSSDEKLNVKLTLDYHIQKIVEDAMDRNGISGAVVIEDVVTGDILAMASRPDFDQYAVENYLDSSGNELFNKATAAYNLGSVFKIVDAAAYFENPDVEPGDKFISVLGINDDNFYNGYDISGPIYKYSRYFNRMHDRGDDLENMLYYCEGSVNINGLVFKCSSYFDGGHGELNMEQAFARSCNSYFIELCQDIGYRNLVNMAEKFGLGAETGIFRQGISESAGSLPPADAYFSPADIANLAIGQGALLATPVQVANMVAVVANGGIKNSVNIVDSIVDSEGNVVRDLKVKEGRRIISKSTADSIKKMMEAVTAYGTGTEAVSGYYGGAGGKTGSAETGRPDVVHAWFAGYFPAKEPRYSVAVFAESGQYGGKVAAPVFAEIAKEMIEKGY